MYLETSTRKVQESESSDESIVRNNARQSISHQQSRPYRIRLSIHRCSLTMQSCMIRPDGTCQNRPGMTAGDGVLLCISSGMPQIRSRLLQCLQTPWTEDKHLRLQSWPYLGVRFFDFVGSNQHNGQPGSQAGRGLPLLQALLQVHHIVPCAYANVMSPGLGMWSAERAQAPWVASY